MWRSTEVGAGEKEMLEHTGHGSFMWRSTRVRAEGNNMIRVHGTLLLDVKKHCHGRVGALIFILSYLRTRDPERILLYVDRSMFVF